MSFKGKKNDSSVECNSLAASEVGYAGKNNDDMLIEIIKLQDFAGFWRFEEKLCHALF